MAMNMYRNIAEAEFINTYVPLDFTTITDYAKMAERKIQDANKKLDDLNTQVPDVETMSDIDREKYYNTAMRPMEEINKIVSETPNALADPDLVRKINYIASNRPAQDREFMSRVAVGGQNQKKYLTNRDPERPEGAALDMIRNWDSETQGTFMQTFAPKKLDDEQTFGQYFKPLKENVTETVDPATGIKTTKSNILLGRIKQSAEASSLNLLNQPGTIQDMYDRIYEDPVAMEQYVVNPNNVDRRIHRSSTRINPETGEEETVWYDAKKYIYDRAYNYGISYANKSQGVDLPPLGRGGKDAEGKETTTASQNVRDAQVRQALINNNRMLYSNPEADKIMNSNETISAKKEYDAAKLKFSSIKNPTASDIKELRDAESKLNKRISMAQDVAVKTPVKLMNELVKKQTTQIDGEPVNIKFTPAFRERIASIEAVTSTGGAGDLAADYMYQLNPTKIEPEYVYGEDGETLVVPKGYVFNTGTTSVQGLFQTKNEFILSNNDVSTASVPKLVKTDNDGNIIGGVLSKSEYTPSDMASILSVRLTKLVAGRDGNGMNMTWQPRPGGQISKSALTGDESFVTYQNGAFLVKASDLAEKLKAKDVFSKSEDYWGADDETVEKTWDLLENNGIIKYTESTRFTDNANDGSPEGWIEIPVTSPLFTDIPATQRMNSIKADTEGGKDKAIQFENLTTEDKTVGDFNE